MATKRKVAPKAKKISVKRVAETPPDAHPLPPDAPPRPPLDTLAVSTLIWLRDDWFRRDVHSRISQIEALSRIHAVIGKKE